MSYEKAQRAYDAQLPDDYYEPDSDDLEALGYESWDEYMSDADYWPEIPQMGKSYFYEP